MRLGGLYPTIAISDAFNVAAHAYAAHLASSAGNLPAMLGFLTVCAAGTVGTARFAFDENLADLNSDLADVAAFVGLPLVGSSFFRGVMADKFEVYSFVVLLVMVEALTRTFGKELRDLSKVFTNLLFFVGPVAQANYFSQDWVPLLGITIFALAGIVITADRERYLFGVRRENLFHYAIGSAAVLIAMGL